MDEISGAALLPVTSTVPVSGAASVPVLPVMVNGPVTVLSSNSTTGVVVDVDGPGELITRAGHAPVVIAERHKSGY